MGLSIYHNRDDFGIETIRQVADERLELFAGVVGTLSSQWTGAQSTPAYRRGQ